jgi:SAM-dependent methyltransferase
MPATDLATTLNWPAWLERWDAMQPAYLLDREARFGLMLDALSVLLPPDFVALDWACGPVAICQRLLARFPNARCVAVDLDPILLALGLATLGDQGGRLRWAEANLLEPDWPGALGEAQFDAVLSTTALHWLSNDGLVRVYAHLGQLIRPGGVFLNGDHLPFSPQAVGLQKVADTLKEKRRSRAFQVEGREDWTHGWDSVKTEPAIQTLWAERERRLAWRPDDERLSGAELHMAALQRGRLPGSG